MNCDHHGDALDKDPKNRRLKIIYNNFYRCVGLGLAVAVALVSFIGINSKTSNSVKELATVACVVCIAILFAYRKANNDVELPDCKFCQALAYIIFIFASVDFWYATIKFAYYLFGSR